MALRLFFFGFMSIKLGSVNAGNTLDLGDTAAEVEEVLSFVVR